LTAARYPGAPLSLVGATTPTIEYRTTEVRTRHDPRSARRSAADGVS
jgi:hypothetical protein